MADGRTRGWPTGAGPEPPRIVQQPFQKGEFAHCPAAAARLSWTAEGSAGCSQTHGAAATADKRPPELRDAPGCLKGRNLCRCIKSCVHRSTDQKGPRAATAVERSCAVASWASALGPRPLLDAASRSTRHSPSHAVVGLRQRLARGRYPRPDNAPASRAWTGWTIARGVWTRRRARSGPRPPSRRRDTATGRS